MLSSSGSITQEQIQTMPDDLEKGDTPPGKKELPKKGKVPLLKNPIIGSAEDINLEEEEKPRKG